MKASVFIATASATAAALCSGATGFVVAPTLAVKVRGNSGIALLLEGCLAVDGL